MGRKYAAGLEIFRFLCQVNPDRSARMDDATGISGDVFVKSGGVFIFTSLKQDAEENADREDKLAFHGFQFRMILKQK